MPLVRTMLLALALLVCGTPSSSAQATWPSGLIAGPGFGTPPPAGQEGDVLADNALVDPNDAAASRRALCVRINNWPIAMFGSLPQRLALTPSQAQLWPEVDLAIDRAVHVLAEECVASLTISAMPLPVALAEADRQLDLYRTALKDIAIALRRLYGALSDAQRKVADDAVFRALF